MTAATLAPPIPPTPERRHDPLGRRYGRLWARVPRELGYLALTAVIGLVTFNILVAGAAPGGANPALLVLEALLLAVLLVASRWLGAFELARQRWARVPAIPAPSWSPVLRGKRPLRALGDVFANGHYWLYALHSLALNPLLAVATSAVWSGWLLSGAVLLTFPAWGLPPFVQGASDLAPGPAGSSIAQLLLVASAGEPVPDDPARAAWLAGGLAALGALLLALLPFVTRGATLAHWGLARLLLPRFPSEDLRGDVARADAARTAAITAEDAALRRLERDIHDGPQQRLLRLQMELSTAERRIERGDGPGESIETARRLAAETLDELRALAQGFAPPLLQDRGLSAALGALGRRGAIPVETAIDLRGGLPDAIERSVYFVAAELVTNAIKHADPTRVRLEARTAEGYLVLTVTDDGAGGAITVPGHGLAGVADRLAGLGGSLSVDSPAGGPTTVTARVPLPIP